MRITTLFSIKELRSNHYNLVVFCSNKVLTLENNQLQTMLVSSRQLSQQVHVCRITENNLHQKQQKIKK